MLASIFRDDALVYAIYQHQDLADIAWMMSKVMPILSGVHFVIWGKWHMHVL